MAYENEIRPAPRTESTVKRTYSDSSSYALPIIALLVVLGVGLWFFSTRDSTPTPTPTTTERTTPTPAPTVPSQAPSVPTPAPTPTPK